MYLGSPDLHPLLPVHPHELDPGAVEIAARHLFLQTLLGVRKAGILVGAAGGAQRVVVLAPVVVVGLPPLFGLAGPHHRAVETFRGARPDLGAVHAPRRVGVGSIRAVVLKTVGGAVVAVVVGVPGVAAPASSVAGGAPAGGARTVGVGVAGIVVAAAAARVGVVVVVVQLDGTASSSGKLLRAAGKSNGGRSSSGLVGEKGRASGSQKRKRGGHDLLRSGFQVERKNRGYVAVMLLFSYC